MHIWAKLMYVKAVLKSYKYFLELKVDFTYFTNVFAPSEACLKKFTLLALNSFKLMLYDLDKFIHLFS